MREDWASIYYLPRYLLAPRETVAGAKNKASLQSLRNEADAHTVEWVHAQIPNIEPLRRFLSCQMQRKMDDVDVLATEVLRIIEAPYAVSLKVLEIFPRIPPCEVE